MNADSWWGAALLTAGGDEPAWTYPGGVMTRTDLRREVAWLAGMFRAHGIRAGDTVALGGDASSTHLWAMFALWSLGTRVVVIPPGVSGDDREQCVRAAGPRFMVVLGADRARRGRFTEHCEVLVRRLPGGQPAGAACLLQFSSGTTGAPKLVARTPASLLAELDRFAALPGMPRAGERVAVLESYTHSYGLIGGVLHALRSGATVVFAGDDTTAARRTAVAEADVVIGTPQHYTGLVAAPPELPPPRLRTALSGGDTLSPEVFAAFRRGYGVTIGQAYGTTETGVIAADPVGRPDGHAVGRPLPGVRTRVVDGVLEVRTAEMADWVSTGDLVHVDPGTGVIRLRGRAGDPRLASLDLFEVERVLRRHHQVIDAVVLGVEPIEAHVAADVPPPCTELRSWCQRFLGRRATPQRYHFVRRLPRTSNGKVLRDRSRLLRLAARQRETAGRN